MRAYFLLGNLILPVLSTNILIAFSLPRKSESIHIVEAFRVFLKKNHTFVWFAGRDYSEALV